MNVRQIEHFFWINKIQVMRISELTRLHGGLAKGQPNALYAIEKRPSPGGTLIIVGVTVATLTGLIIHTLNHLFDSVGLCC